MADSYIPRQDHQALAWMATFSQNIQSSPSTYSISAAEAQTIVDAVQDFADALAVSDNEMTRNEGTVNAKNQARNSAESLCRQFAVRIKYDNGITDEQKIYVGVRPVNYDREPIYCPQTSPLLNIVANTPGAQTVKFADSLDPSSRAKPFGAASLQLFVAIGDDPIDDESQATFIGNYTRNPIAVAFDEEDNKKVATYFARWCGKRGDIGPWSLPVSMTIAA